MPYRSPQWVRRNGRERTIDALDQLRGNRRMKAEVSYRSFLEEMRDRLRDALDADDYSAAQVAALFAVQNAITPLLDFSSETTSAEAVAALEAAADKAFSITADGDWPADK